MKKHVWAWTIGGALFIMIVGLWVWQLPGAIKRIGGLHDQGVGAILSVFGSTKNSLSPELIKARAQFDSNLKAVNKAISTQTVKAAVIEDLKNKIENKGNVPAPSMAPAPAAGSALPAPKTSVKK